MAKRDVVKQLSNLSIDEISLVDRGANQHALVSIAKRAPEIDDLFETEEVEKDWSEWNERRKADNHDAKAWVKQTGGYGLKGYKNRSAALKQNDDYKEGGKKVNRGVATEVAGLYGGGGAALYAGAKGHTKTSVAAGALGAAATIGGIHHAVQGGKQQTKGLVDTRTAALGDKAQYKPKVKKSLDLDELFAEVEKKSSFGRGGESAGVDQHSGSDPAGVVTEPNGEKGDIGPNGGKLPATKIKGKKTPPEKESEKAAGSENGPSTLSGLGKSADFWTRIIEKALDDEDVEKHFPGGGAPNPMNSPFPGATGPGAAPTMQTPGVQPMGMGQPTPPPGMGGGMGQQMPGQPTGGMPQQLPPDVVAYIQQLEQALQEATGGASDDDSDGDSDNSSTSSDSDSSKKNPFGKSGDFGMDTNDLFLAELAKSLDQEDNRELIGKAYEAVSKAEQRAAAAEEIAKQERDLRLEREFIAKAEEFNVPVPAKELGPVLKRLAESVSTEDFQVVVKCLRASTEQSSLFQEFGKRGGGDNANIFDEVENRALAILGGEGVAKSLTQEQAVAQVFEMDPRAYDAYVAERRQALR